MDAIHRTKFVIKIGEYFSRINQFMNRLQNFISLNFSKKSLRYAFLSKSRHQKLNPQWKNLGSVALEQGDLILANCGFKGLRSITSQKT
jgi:hypothetical protein